MEVMCTNIPRRNKLKITFEEKKKKRRKKGGSMFSDPVTWYLWRSGRVHAARFADYSCGALSHTHSSNMMQSHCALINLSIIPRQAIQSALCSLVGGRCVCTVGAEFTVCPSTNMASFFSVFSGGALIQKHIVSS